MFLHFRAGPGISNIFFNILILVKSIFLSKIVLQHWLLICKLRKKSFVLFPYISKKFTLSKRSRITIFENAINVQDSNTTEYSKGCRYSSVDSSAPSILPPQVWVPSTPSTLSSIYIAQIVYLSFELECEKNQNKQKEAGISPLKNFYLFSPSPSSPSSN